MSGIYGQSHHFARIQIDHGGDVNDLGLKVHMGEVCRPNMVGIYGECREKKIWIDNLDILGLFPSSASPSICLDPEEVHDTLHFLSVHLKVNRQAS